MKLLLLSNSTNSDEEYLAWAKVLLSEFQKDTSIQSSLFIPYAGVTVEWDSYTEKVSNVFHQLGIDVKSIQSYQDPIKAIKDAESIIVGGGNTFRLVQQLYNLGLMNVIRDKVLQETPYIGWSAGTNIACPTMCTTNDMPIVQPKNFVTLGLVPFQINPHYTDAEPVGHGGETREQRILEYLALNHGKVVIGLREGTALWIDGPSMKLKGNKTMRLFSYNSEPLEIDPNAGASFL